MASLYQSKWATPPPKQEAVAAPPTESALAASIVEGPKTQQAENSTTKQTAPAAEKPVSVTALSAKADEFSPVPAPEPQAQAPEIDQFAQTGADQDDLFDDYEESMQTREQDDLFGDDFTPLAEDEEAEQIEIVAPAAPVEQAPIQQARASESRGRGRGRGRGGQHRNVGKENVDKPAQAQAPEGAPTGPKKETLPAVRGDRQATGGIKKPKLSEAELTEKLAQISIKNASLAAAHARAEADAASFEQREAQAKVEASQKSEAAKARVREEKRDRQQMNGEREKNRLRKLKAIGGREWDAEKNDDDFAKGGRFDKKTSATTDQEYSDGREYLLRDARPNGGNQAGRQAGNAFKETVPKREDFPALPSSGDQPLNTAKLNESSGKSWADQVESATN